jgi:hypothetical protein
MKKLLIILATIAVSANSVFAGDKPLIDPELAKVEIGLAKQKSEECNNALNIYAKMECGNNIRKKLRKDGKIRGTEEYFEKHYAKLNFAALEKLFKKLTEQQQTARKSLDILEDNDREYGELSKEDLQSEISWIESRLARMQKDMTRQKEKKLHYGEIK